jgi:SpoVK/Ycf46/Vps4 family AAA+-type ATPase
MLTYVFGNGYRFMSLAPQELENSASKYAAEAIKFDSQGSRGLAIQAYQRAVEVLVKLIQIYPDYKLNKIYMQRASNYQNRIKTLQMPSGITGSQNEHNVLRIKSGEQLSPDSGTSNGRKRENVTENLGADFDDLVMKDKPNVSWDQVIGLDDAKRAIRESIVYPTKRMIYFY